MLDGVWCMSDHGGVLEVVLRAGVVQSLDRRWSSEVGEFKDVT